MWPAFGLRSEKVPDVLNALIWSAGCMFAVDLIRTIFVPFRQVDASLESLRDYWMRLQYLLWKSTWKNWLRSFVLRHIFQRIEYGYITKMTIKRKCNRYIIVTCFSDFEGLLKVFLLLSFLSLWTFPSTASASRSNALPALAETRINSAQHRQVSR